MVEVSLGPGSCLSKSSIMEAPVDDHCINMEDVGPPTPKLPAELRCSQITSVGKELEIYQIRKDFINNMIDLENRTPSATTETKSKLEEELKTLDENISVLEATSSIKTNTTNKNNNEEFVFPKKTTKNIPIKEMEKLATTNAFAALNTAENDAEDVSPPK
ncbi:uncharacterized protein TNCV_1640061 [Trichonephila clavipes]|nr:uncharacterized protein TNCV_1640061 [Trichonephila clavipes]